MEGKKGKRRRDFGAGNSRPSHRHGHGRASGSMHTRLWGNEFISQSRLYEERASEIKTTREAQQTRSHAQPLRARQRQNKWGSRPAGGSG